MGNRGPDGVCGDIILGQYIVVGVAVRDYIDAFIVLGDMHRRQIEAIIDGTAQSRQLFPLRVVVFAEVDILGVNPVCGAQLALQLDVSVAIGPIKTLIVTRAGKAVLSTGIHIQPHDFGAGEPPDFHQNDIFFLWKAIEQRKTNDTVLSTGVGAVIL